jgi:hypothetical protein
MRILSNKGENLLKSEKRGTATSVKYDKSAIRTRAKYNCFVVIQNETKRQGWGYPE